MFVIPMMGKSSRFADAGYSIPKYMLPLQGKSVFEHVLQSFSKYFDTDIFVFAVPASGGVSDFVSEKCDCLGVNQAKVLELDVSTSGQAETVSVALERVGLEDELYVYNADTFRPGFLKPDTANIDGLLDVFVGEGDHWSFVEAGPNNSVLRTAEKTRISSLCSDGMYYFSAVDIFLEAYRASAASTVAISGETYIAPIYNSMIDAGLRVNYRKIDFEDVVFCGTPSEYEQLLAAERQR